MFYLYKYIHQWFLGEIHVNKENFNLEKFNLENFNLENVDKDEIKRFFNENTNNLKIELTKLQSDMLSAYVSENDFKNLRLFLIENFKTNQKGSITLNLIKLLFIIYLNKDNKYEFLNKLIYGNKSNDIVIGMIRDCYIELYLENKNLPRNDAFKKGDIDNFLPQNNYIFPFDASIINSGRSNIFDITNRFVRQYQANANVINKELNKINNLFITFNKKMRI